MSRLGLFFLGGFDVTLDAEPVTAFGADKVRAMLAFLAIESARPLRREKIAGMFWPEHSSKQAAHNLSQSLLRLRKALREQKNSPTPSYLLVTPQDVQFNAKSNYLLDVLHFRALMNQRAQHRHLEALTCPVCAQWLQQAVELYRGELLAGLFVPDSVIFEEWRLMLQEELHRQAVEALHWLSVYHEQRGEYAQVEKFARRQIALEPWHEEAHGQIMRAFVQQGHIVAALQQYSQYRRILDEELGIKPSASITRYYEQIRAGEVVPKARVQQTVGEASWLAQEGEQRQITVLACKPIFADDTRETGAQMQFCELHCQVIYHRFVGQRMPRRGDSCLVNFGFPQAFEDAPRRAVHAALAVIAALEGNEAMQIGIHTGMVTVGQKRGQRWQDRDLMGQAFQIARDSQRLAGPNEVLITEGSRLLVQDSFDLQPLTASHVGTADHPIHLYQVHGEGDLQGRLNWLVQTQRLTTFTGRAKEMARLESCHERLLQGTGQVVFIRGEPGIGKSRLVWELEQSMGNTDSSIGERPTNQPTLLWLTSRCLAHYQNSSLFPLIGLLEKFLDFQAGDSSAVRQEKLSKMLDMYRLNRPAARWLLTLLLGLPAAGAVPETITKAQREQMRQLFITFLQKRAADQPLVLVIEDLQWSDPSTVAWLGQSISDLVAMPCLTILTGRPEFNPLWLAHEDLQPDLRLLTLDPLPPQAAEQMVFSVTGKSLLNAVMRQEIVTKTDGIPLFVEELTKTLIEQSAFKDTVGGVTTIPPTLQDSLVARLDHLGAAKETAQWAAVLGREFSYPVLQACAPYDVQRLQNDLERLIEAELVSPIHDRPSNGATADRFTFRHALMQEAAYGSLLQHTRELYHRRTAETLETDFPQIAATRPEILADHFANAGLSMQAVDYWLLAGERATKQGATLEARIFFDRALERIAAEDHERRWRSLSGREAIFNLREERAAQYADILALLELAEILDDDTRRAQAFMRQGMYALRRKDFALMLPAVEAAVRAAARAGNHRLEVHGLTSKVTGLTYVGHWEAAHQAAEETLAKLPIIEDEVFRGYVHGDLSFYYSRIGDLSRALQLMILGAEAARRTGDQRKESRLRLNIGFVNIQLGRFVAAQAAFEEGLALAETMGDQALQTSHRYNLSYAIWCSGDGELAQEVGKQALSEFQTTGSNTLGQACCLAYLGIYLEAAGDLTAATDRLAEARKLYASIGVLSYRMEAQATEARCLKALGQLEVARQLATEVWAYLHEHGTKGIDFPSRVYLCLGEGLGNSEYEVIDMGYRDLMERAKKISDTDWRRSFLQNVIENDALITRWEKMAVSS